MSYIKHIEGRFKEGKRDEGTKKVVLHQTESREVPDLICQILLQQFCGTDTNMN
jgi:hypothetical protein